MPCVIDLVIQLFFSPLNVYLNGDFIQVGDQKMVAAALDYLK